MKAKLINPDNAYIRVTPIIRNHSFPDYIQPGARNHDYLLGELNDLVREITRHIDFDTATIVVPAEDCCSHCGYGWSEDSDTYNGGCCGEDEKNNPDKKTPS